MGKAKKKRKRGPQHEIFVFRRTDSIGAADAADDQYLAECFVDTGDISVLRDLKSPRRLVVGRTGTGKSALLAHLAATVPNHAIEVRAESLALAHVSNSTILRFLRELGVKLDLFFRLLWRHVFAVEILKRRFRITDETQKRSFWDRIADLFRDQKHRQALKYLQDWGGDKFWEETDYRVKELTSKLETEISKSIGADVAAKILSIKGDVQKAQRFSEEEKIEVRTRAQKVVNDVQIRELSYVIDLIDHVLSESSDYYYILIDRLDENWADDDVRYLLIRALLETAKDFSRVSRCKAIIALRVDLLEQVFERSRDAGFQEEKFRAMMHEIRWSDQQLEKLLDRRVDELIRRRYTKQGVRHTDVMPTRVGAEKPTDFLLSRTLQRPRDLIHFFNLCIEASDAKPNLSRGAILDAELRYSKERIRFLRDEWYVECPELLEFVGVLRGKAVLVVQDIDTASLKQDALEVVIRNSTSSAITNRYAADDLDGVSFRQWLVSVFYKIGLVGIKLHPDERILWSYRGDRSVDPGDIALSSRIYVHKLAWRALGIAAE